MVTGVSRVSPLDAQTVCGMSSKSRFGRGYACSGEYRDAMNQRSEIVSIDEAEAMMALRERLLAAPQGVPLEDVALAMGLTVEEARSLLLQVRSAQGTLSEKDLAQLRRPPRLAFIALATIASCLAAAWIYSQFLNHMPAW
jgi:hypothetical protein